tara:strand:+ start:228 stop:533 length:306 start_codon:yes stop_codon:yes gene_type:complete
MLKLTLKDLWDLREWVDQMYWDYDRLSRSGQDTLKKISNKLGMDTSDYLSEKCEDYIEYLKEKNPTWSREKVYSESLKVADIIDTMDISKLYKELRENEKN